MTVWLIFGGIHGLNTKNSQKLLDSCQNFLDVLVCKCPAQSRAVWKLPKSDSVFIRLSNGVWFVLWWMMIQPPGSILCGYFFFIFDAILPVFEAELSNVHKQKLICRQEKPRSSVNMSFQQFYKFSHMETFL